MAERSTDPVAVQTADSRWRLERQSWVVVDATGGDPLPGPVDGGVPWPTAHRTLSLTLIESLTEHALALDESEASAARVGAAQPAGIDVSSDLVGSVEQINVELTEAREHLLRASVAADGATATIDALGTLIVSIREAR